MKLARSLGAMGLGLLAATGAPIAFCNDRRPSFAPANNIRRRAPGGKDVGEEPSTLDDLVVIGGNGHPTLSKDVASLLGVSLADAELTRFSDGEISIKVNDSIRGKNVFIIQSCSAPVNESILELLLSVSCAKRSGANRVVAVIPYFGYKHHRRGASLSTRNHSRFLTSGATDFAKMLQAMGVDRVIAVDLQRPGQGHEACFFDNSVPTETIISTGYLVDYFVRNVDLKLPLVVVAPNSESVKRARNVQLGLQEYYGSDVKLAAFMIETPADNLQQHSSHRLLGNPKLNGADVIIVDDMVDTAGTLSDLSNQLVQAGVNRIYLCASHGLFTSKAMDIIDNVEALTKVVVTNSLPLPKRVSHKVHQVSIAPMLAEVIRAEHFRSVVSLDRDESYESEDH